ncbi:MAG TPA: ATP-binding protein [Patescibacteria group bacterium]|nr:ATP-binding protein [Patescibacteria group bacterium]
MKLNLQRKMLLNFMLVIVLVLAGVLTGLSFLIRDYFMQSKQQELLQKGQELSRTLQAYYEGRIDRSQLTGFLDSVDHLLDARVWALDTQGQLLAMSTPGPRQMMGGHGPGHMGHGRRGGPVMAPENGNGPPALLAGVHRMAGEMCPVFQGQIWQQVLDHPYYGEKMMAVGVPVFGSDGKVLGGVLLNAPVTGIDDVMERIFYHILLAGVLGALAAIFVVNRLAGGIVRPLKTMQEAAGTMARGQYDVRVPASERDEVGQLGGALNSLARDLAGFVERAEKTEKIRRDFVANVSHELRTPITVIRGYSEAMLDGIVQEPELQEKYHRLIGAETVRLERLVKDLLDLSRLQSPEVPMEMEEVPLGELAAGVVMMLQPRAREKGLELIWTGEEDLPPVWGNGDRLTQLFLILLDNAMNHTASGGQVVLAAVREPRQENGELLVSVSDTGDGIPAEDLPYIWERFYKVDKSHARTKAGMGLGLSLAREIIDRHGFRVEVKSEPGQGTVFLLRFPTEKNSARQDGGQTS